MGAWEASSQDPDLSFAEALLFNLNQAGPHNVGMTPENLWTLFTGDQGIFEEGYKQDGILDVLGDFGASAFTDKRMESDWPETIIKRSGEFFGESLVPGQLYNTVETMIRAQFGRDPQVGRMLHSPDMTDVWKIVFRLARSYDAEGDQQLRLLGRMINDDVDTYKAEKYNAGTSGRADMAWEQGSNWEEDVKSDRGREAWQYSLTVIQNKVDDFKTLTGGNFTDAEIAEYLQDLGIRKSEIPFIVNGDVDKMTVDDFTIDHQPRKTQSGEAEIIAYFESRKGKPVRYRELYDQLKDSGKIIPDDFNKFLTKAKNVRRTWRKSQSAKD